MEDYHPDELDESCIVEYPGAEVTSIADLFKYPISVYDLNYAYDQDFYYQECIAVMAEFENDFMEVADDFTKVHIRLEGTDLPEQIQKMVLHLQGNANGTIVYSPPWELVTWSTTGWENVYFYFQNKRDALMFKLKWA